MSELINEAT